MRKLVFFIFLASGATGLVYEVLWSKYLSDILGNTSLAHTIVLATFLAGLAIGNSVLGRWGNRLRRPLAAYGYLEVAIGISAAMIPAMLELGTELFVFLAKNSPEASVVRNLSRVLLSTFLLLLPTFFMGGTLPILSRFALRQMHSLERDLSKLYFINSLGAVVGSLMAAFVLIPKFGLGFSNALTCCTNILLGLAAIGLEKLPVRFDDFKSPSQSAHRKELVSPSQYKGLLAAVLFSGVISLSYEIGWIRMLTLTFGSSVYSFAVMLSAFIAGIALGSYFISRGVFQKVKRFTLFGFIQVAIALSVIITLLLYERVPYLLLHLRSMFSPRESTFLLFETIKFFMAFGLMLLPTIFIGMTLPLATRIATTSMTHVSSKIGTVFSFNTTGNVIGAALAGLFLLPWLGMQRLMELGVAFNLILGFGIFIMIRDIPLKRLRIGGAAAALCFGLYLALRPAWDVTLISSGPFRQKINEYRLRSFQEYKDQIKKGSETLFYVDDSNGTISVHNAFGGEHLVLRVNGKPDASTLTDMPTQSLIAHLPLMFAERLDKVLIVGLGSGVTAGAALQYPIQHLDLVEISKGVIQAAKYFKNYNYDVVANPRLHLHVEDAKTFMKLNDTTYDVIISEPTNPWIAGVGNLFTSEFYEDAKKRLTPGGVMVQWFHTYELTDSLVWLILSTFGDHFKHLTLWQMASADFAIVATDDDRRLDVGTVLERMKIPGVRKDLERVGISSPVALLGLQMLDSEAVRFSARFSERNTQEFPLLEYGAPYAFFIGQDAGQIRRLDLRNSGLGNKRLLLGRYLEKTKYRLTNAEWASLARSAETSGAPRFLQAVLAAWERALPDSEDVQWELARSDRNLGRLEAGIGRMEKLIQRAPKNILYHRAAAWFAYERFTQEKSIFHSDELLQAAVKYLHALDREERSAANRAETKRRLASVQSEGSDPQKAFPLFEEAAQTLKDVTDSLASQQKAEIWKSAASASVRIRDYSKAIHYAERALAENPRLEDMKELLRNIRELMSHR